MSEQLTVQDQFIERLTGLSQGELAQLKRSAGKPVALSRGAIGTFYRILPRPVPRRDEEIYFVVATLFGLNKYKKTGNFGLSMKEVKRKSGSDGTDRRFTVLLDSELDERSGQHFGGELAYRLRQCVKLTASKEVGIDWVQLLDDLLSWSYPEKWVQKQWARTYFTDIDNESKGGE